MNEFLYEVTAQKEGPRDKEWKDWEVDENSEKDLAERRVGENTLSAMGGTVGAKKASSEEQYENYSSQAFLFSS